jgi:hypothetical protein
MYEKDAFDCTQMHDYFRERKKEARQTCYYCCLAGIWMLMRVNNCER